MRVWRQENKRYIERPGEEEGEENSKWERECKTLIIEGVWYWEGNPDTVCHTSWRTQDRFTYTHLHIFLGVDKQRQING